MRKVPCDYCGRQSVYGNMFRHNNDLICHFCMMRVLEGREQFHKAQSRNKQMGSKVSR